MKKFKQLLAVTFALCIGISAGLMAQGQPETPKKEKITKEEREALRGQLRAEIAAIEADPKLSVEEKETQVKEKRRAWAIEMRKGKRGEYRGGARGKGKAENMERRKARLAAFEEELKSIENNPDLTDEQKKEAKAKLKQENRAKHHTGEHRKENGPGKGKMNDKRRDSKEEMRKDLDAIDNDPNLTPEQKRAAKTRLKEEKKAEFSKKKEEWLKSHPKGERPQKGGKDHRKGKRKLKAKKLNEKIDSGLSPEEKSKVLQRLDKLDAKLDAQKKKGKISVESYEKRKAEITALRSKL